MPHDAMTVCVLRNEVLIPEFVSGENSHVLSSLRIPIGEGLVGWVAQNAKPILNGNPSVEPGYINDPKYGALRSALAVPLEGASRVVAVLAVYRVPQDAFTREDLSVLLTLASTIGRAVESAVRSGKVSSVVKTSGLAASAGN